MCILSQVFDGDWEIDRMSKLVGSQDASFDIGFVLLVVQPKLSNYHHFDIVVQVLNFIPFVVCKIIFNFFPLNVVKFADLVQGVSLNIL